MCNPRITFAAEPREVVVEEGCLSLPGVYLPVARPDFAICHGQDQFGQPMKVAGTGMLARCLQHETEHLDGIVMEDHLTEAERRDLRRQHRRAAFRFPSSWPAE